MAIAIRPILSALRHNKTGTILIAAQIALTLAIVSNAMYIIRDRLHMIGRPSGVSQEENVLRMDVAVMKDGPDLVVQQKQDEALLRAVPGVVNVIIANQTPLSQSGWNMGITVDRKDPNGVGTAFYMDAGGLVKTLGLKIIAGRDFEASDVVEVDFAKNRDFGRVAIITQALAKKLYPQAENVVGKPLFVGTGDDGDELQIIGVVERLQSPWAQTKENGEFAMLTGLREIASFSHFVIRTEPGASDRVIKDATDALNKAPGGRLVVQSATVARDRNIRYRDDRGVAWMLSLVSILLLVVTASGIVGMATFWVNQRRKQIGIRRAIGASKFEILRYFLTENVLITSAGIALGCGLAIALNQLLVSKLELQKLPLMYLAVGAVILWVIGILAVYLPAKRASDIAPAVATRSV
jgi:putative ABC transport system permease protein